MIKKMMVLALLGSFLGLAACNTVHGVGKDTERAGEKVQDAADRNR